MMLRLGQYVRDSITGFRGVVVARMAVAFGVPRVLIQPPQVGADGGWIEARWVDEPRCLVLVADPWPGVAPAAPETLEEEK